MTHPLRTQRPPWENPVETAAQEVARAASALCANSVAMQILTSVTPIGTDLEMTRDQVADLMAAVARWNAERSMADTE